MYKAGKNWVVVPLVFLGIMAGLGAFTQTTMADTINSDATPSQLVPEKGSTVASREKEAQVTNASEGSALTSAPNTTEMEVQDESTVSSDQTAPSSEQSQADTTDIPANEQLAENKQTVETSSEQSNAVTQDTKFPQPQDAVEIQENGYWYLYNPRTNNKYTGFQTLKDGRVVYYNGQGQMQYGEQNIDRHWYLFDQWTGAMKTGFQYIPKYQKTVYYNQDGQMQYGWQQVKGQWYYLENGSGSMYRGQKKIAGHWYNFDRNNGQMSTGFTYLPDDKKTVYYAANGWMVYGEKQINGYWYLFDQGSGRMLTGFQKLPDGRTVYYNDQGHMQYGEQKIGSGWTWYLFDQSSGAMKNGFQTLADGRKVYYAPNGQMQYGEQRISGYWYLFDSANGAMKTGFQYIPKYQKTVYYNANGQMQYGWQQVSGHWYYLENRSGAMVRGQKQINGHWYNFDQNNGQMSTGFTYLPDDKKTVYYAANGWMVYGEKQINNYWYLFEKGSGKMQTGFQTLPDGRRVYYNNQGQMQYGWQTISGQKYYFDLGSGAMAKGRQTIANVTYYFDPTSGIMKKGEFFYDPQNALLLYATSTGQLAKAGEQDIVGTTCVFDDQGAVVHVSGEAQIAGHWYLFGKNNQVLVGFQKLSDGRTVYYSPKTAQMQYYQQQINNHWYLFDKGSGAMKTGFQYITEQKKIVYYAGNGQMVYGWQNMYGNWYFFDRESGAQAKSEILRIDGHYYAFDGRGNAHDFNELNSLINRLGSNISVAIQSQRSGQIYTYSNAGNRRYSTASTVKVAVLAELLHNRGGNLTAEERHLAEIMIRNSDNGATTNLIRYHLREAGSPVNRLYRDLGMRNTTPSSSWGATQTTPADQLKLLYQIFMTDHSSYLNRKSQDYIRHLMHTVSAGQRWGISAGSSDYYLKNGWVTFGWNGNDPWFVNSIGFIPNNGHGYTIAIYSANNPLSQGINKIEQVARKVSQILK
ncbi:N-acetylmuramoyl-L-alanine amidase [Ligilactobacillus saerimneri]|uniref:N-acetylmuramoyl-L-alanine amidase n=2 Tax=Ligilactobacillus saerimneri TaxID=228229 RepID=A0A7H9ELE8_9LACO|nr:N-acetylmuramoyl-L-alanine amidase [Ligilactobacillus saerimneri]